jgi:hypothetical protein
MAAVTAAAPMSTATVAAVATSAGVGTGAAIVAGAVMSLGGGSASARKAYLGDGSPFPIIGVAALFAFNAQQEEEQRAERESEKQNDFESGFHRIGRKRIFAPTSRDGQDESGEQI